MTKEPKQNETYLKKGHAFKPLMAHISPKLETILRKNRGIDIQLLESWPQIVGETMSRICFPFKISRGLKRGGKEKKQVENATLNIVCAGLNCLKVQHQADEIIEKINLFFGFQAIEKIKIVQKSLFGATDRPEPARSLTYTEESWLEEQTASVDDTALRACLARLGKNIISKTPHHQKTNIL